MTKEYMFLVYRWVKSFQNSGSIFSQKIQIVRGTIPKAKSNAGRPRNKYNAKEDANNLS